MPTDEADQSQAGKDLGQASVRLNVSQAISTGHAPPSPTSVTVSADSPLGSHPKPCDFRQISFLRLPAELRNVIYGMLLTLDPHPFLIEHDGEFCVLPNTAILYINKQVREEAMEIIRNQNTWVLLEVNNRDSDLDTLPYREVLSNQALIPRAWMGNLRPFVRSRSVVIVIGMAYGGRDVRPMQRHYTSVHFLLPYSRQGFTYLCLRLWQCAGINKDMTVILNMPHTSRDALIIRSIISELSHIRGFDMPLVKGSQMYSRNCSWSANDDEPSNMEGCIRAPQMVERSRRSSSRQQHARRGDSPVQNRVPHLRFYSAERSRLACGGSKISECLRSHRHRISLQKVAAILVFTSSCSDEQFVGLSEQLIEEAVQAANRALLSFPGMYNDYRVRAYELRGKAFKARAAYRSRSSLYQSSF